MAKRFLPLAELQEFEPLELSSGVAGQDEDTLRHGDHRSTKAAHLIGWSEQNSTPPAMATSAWPVWIRLMHEVTAWLAEMHAIVTVWPGVESGNPGKSAKKVQDVNLR